MAERLSDQELAELARVARDAPPDSHVVMSTTAREWMLRLLQEIATLRAALTRTEQERDEARAISIRDRSYVDRAYNAAAGIRQQRNEARQALREIIAQLVWCEDPRADDLESVRYAVRIARAALPASEPHVVGTEAPTPENDPVGRFRPAGGNQS